ncbi:hypothetical protein NPIL_324101 [Nephila pilipes]|uniref:Uncharacterized protein n=1 Tax=Nephila pilipes TaxID=299642 RepID=A0A8X6PDW5_NEPPI|nr:hypothetical protein NPIL_324101 [Nephila pilipes]
MPGYTNADEYPPVEPRIHENYSMGVVSCEHPWQGNYSTTVIFNAECYEGTTVLLRPFELDTTAMGTRHLV